MSSVIEVRDAIVSGLEAKLTELAGRVEAHDGEIDVAAVKRYFTHGIHARVAVLGSSRLERKGTMHVPYRHALFGIYVGAAGKAVPATSSGDVAMALVERIEAVVEAERWSDTASGSAQRVRSRNLFSGQLDALGLSLWAITFEQSYELTALAADNATLDRLLSIYRQSDTSKVREGREHEQQVHFT